MASIQVTAIVPKKKINAARVPGDLRAELDRLALSIEGDMRKYPAAMPWKNPPPRYGPRAGGRRTGMYGKSWHVSNPSEWVRRVSNEISYGVYVGGPTDKRPGQTAVMRARNWPSVTKVARDQARKHKATLIRAVTGFKT